jgi:hypothetical protein
MKTFLILKETIVFLVMERFGIRFFCTGLLFLIAIGYISCGKKSRSDTTTDVSTYQEVRLIKIKFNFNQSFEIREVKKSSSMAQIHVQGIGFQQANQTLCFDKVSPFESALVADIDNNGFEELYVITRSRGKKKQAGIYGIVSVGGVKYKTIYIPEFDAANGSSFSYLDGYKGNDSIFIKDKTLKRIFQVTFFDSVAHVRRNGFREITYKLVEFDNSFSLQVSKVDVFNKI